MSKIHSSLYQGSSSACPKITPPLTRFSGTSSSNTRDLAHLEILPRRRPSDKPFPTFLTGKMTLLGQATLTYHLIRAAGAAERIPLSAGASVVPLRSGFG